MNTVLLIDGDIFAYKASFGNESEVDLGDDVVSLTADLPEIESTIDSLIEGVASKLGADRTVVALTGDTNFRKTLYADYKANRGSRRKPLGLRHAKDYIARKWETKIKEGIEADDTLGILCTHPTLIPGKRIIVSIDKDLLQIPGRHYNPDKDEKRVVSEAQGDRAFYMQCLTGDATDNYPGVPGIGPKKAAALLSREPVIGGRPPDPWRVIRATYEAKGLTEADALVQARLARILRHTDYDFKKKEPILWTP